MSQYNVPTQCSILCWRISHFDGQEFLQIAVQ